MAAHCSATSNIAPLQTHHCATEEDRPRQLLSSLSQLSVESSSSATAASMPLQCSAVRKPLSAAALPWYPPRHSESSSSSQPYQEDEFPCEPAGRATTAGPVAPHGGAAVVRRTGTSPDARQPTPPCEGGSVASSKGGSHLRFSMADDDEDDIIVRFRDDEALDEASMIRRMAESHMCEEEEAFQRRAEGAFWGTTNAPVAEGLQHIRSVWDLPPAGDSAGGDPNATAVEREEEWEEWEDDSAAYEDSLDSEQLEWLEEQLQARDNPDDFFF